METQIVKLESSDLARLPENKAEQIRQVFIPMTERLSELEEEYNEILVGTEFGIDKASAIKARNLRLRLGAIRIATEKSRKKIKEEYLRAGKAIDGLSNIVKWAVEGKEAELKEIEDHEALAEKKRLDELQTEREELLAPYIEDLDTRRDLSGMDKDVWESYLQVKIKDHNHRVQAEREASEAAAKQKEIDDAELARVAKENEELKQKAEAERAEHKCIQMEAIAKIEAERKERFDIEAKARAAQAEKDAEAKLVADAKAKEAADKLAAETKAREDAEAELKAKQDAEKKAESDRLQKIQDDLNKGDKEKMSDLQADLRRLTTAYTFKSDENLQIYKLICTDLRRYITEDESDGL